MGHCEDERARTLSVWLGRAAIVPALTASLGLGAVSSLGAAWMLSAPTHPFVADPSDVDHVLVKTTGVVAGMVAILLGYAVFAWYARRSERRDGLLAYLAPTLLLVAVLGGVARCSGSTSATFDSAARQEAGLEPAHSSELASLAWWSACLAVAALALLCWRGVPTPDEQPGKSFRRGAVLTGLVALVAGALVIAPTLRPAGITRLAVATDVPATTELTGTEAYSFDVRSSGGDSVLAGGPGFIRTFGERYDDTGREKIQGVEGVDGRTGDVRWQFARPHLSAVPRLVTGTGPDGVVIVSASYDDDPLLVGLDAATGAPLWTRPERLNLLFDPVNFPLDRPAASDEVLLAYLDDPASQVVRVLGLSPRTGATMWETTSPKGCDAPPRVTKTRVVTAPCESGGDLVATVRDARTGEVTSEVRAPSLGVDPNEFHASSWLASDPGTDAVVVSFTRPDTFTTELAKVVDVVSGQVVMPLPDDAHGYFVDATTLILDGGSASTPNRTYSIVDVTTGRTIPTDVPSGVVTSVDPPGDRWVRFGQRWITASPDGRVLRTFSADAPPGALPSPCAAGGKVPRLIAASGALLVNCGSSIVALH